MTWSGFGTTALIYLSPAARNPDRSCTKRQNWTGRPRCSASAMSTLPHLYPVMSLMFVLQMIAVVQVFTEPFLLTNGGPGRETLTPAMHIYNRAFIRMDMGYASAWSVALIVVLLMFSHDLPRRQQPADAE